MKMQSVLDRWNTRRSAAVPPGLIGRIAPTRTEGINLRGVFTFPFEARKSRLPQEGQRETRAISCREHTPAVIIIGANRRLHLTRVRLQCTIKTIPRYAPWKLCP